MKKTVVIHTGIFQALQDVGKFYYYLRYLDVKGSGWAEVNLDDTSNDLCIAKSTFYKYLKNKEFIRKVVSIKPRHFRVHYCSAIKLATKYILDEKINGIGTASEVYLEELINWRQEVTIAEAITLQTQSIYAAKKTAKERGIANPNYINLDKVFLEKTNILYYKKKETKDSKKKQSANGTGSLSYMRVLDDSLILKKVFNKNRVFVYFNSENYIPIGGCQETLAERMILSRRTIQRRLRWVDKMQQAYTNPDIVKDMKMDVFRSKEDWTTYTDKYFAIALRTNPNFPDHRKEELFQSYTNLYNPNQVNIKGIKSFRKKVQRKVDLYYERMYQSNKLPSLNLPPLEPIPDYILANCPPQYLHLYEMLDYNFSSSG